MEALAKIQQEFFSFCNYRNELGVDDPKCHQHEEKIEGVGLSSVENGKKYFMFRIANDRKVKNSNCDIFVDLREAKINGAELKENGFLTKGLPKDRFISSLILNDACTTVSVILNRKMAIKAFITETLRSTSMLSCAESNQICIIYPNIDHGSTSEEHFKTARTLAIASHLQKILEQNGQRCHLLLNQCTESHIDVYGELFKEIFESKLEDLHSQKEIIEKIKGRLVEDAKVSLYKKDNKGGDEIFPVELDFGRYLKENGIKQGKDGFDVNLKTSVVVNANNCASNCLWKTAAIEQGLNAVIEKKNDKVWLFTVTNSSQAYESQISCISVNMLSRNSQNIDKMTLCSCGPCSVNFHKKAEENLATEPEVLRFKDYVRLKSKEIRNSYISRYGPEVEGGMWESVISDVTAACIRFDLLSSPLQSKVLLNVNDFDGETASSRQSIFVLYNYSRLATLLSRFEEEVRRGTFPALPSIDDVDFALLREEQEWRIFVKYVMFYPILVDELKRSLSEVSTFQIRPSTNKICGFLSNLSRDLSSYYHQTKVLLEPRTHLLPLMYARVYFIKAVEKVMLNAFKLIGINPPSQM